jgi:hypothetical protein
MPIHYRVDSQRGIVTSEWQGVITAEDLERHWRDYLSDPEVVALRRGLPDLRQAKFRFSGDDLARLIEAIVIPALAGRAWKSAMVVDTPDQYGVARQYQVYAEPYSRDAIFRDPDEALHWLVEE